MTKPSQSRPKDDPKVKRKPTSKTVDAEEEDDDDFEDESGNRFLLFNVMPSWMVSFLTHIAVIIILAILVMPPPATRNVALEAGEQTATPLDDLEMDLSTLEFEETDILETEMTEEEPTDIAEVTEVSLPEAEIEFGNIMGMEEAFESDIMGELSDAALSDETSSRTGNSKDRMLKEYGGNSASEESVALALKWLANHQLENGGWCFDHKRGNRIRRNDNPCQQVCNCGDPGNKSEALSGATAIALLPFLGSGHTHETGEYKDVVFRGLEFLMKRAKRRGRGISYLEPGGTMYSHGLVAILFGEAYAMTKDPVLAPYAQGTLWFIEDAQDPIGGGWRYQPNQPGDTSVVGWQLMALKSGKITGLNINPRTYVRAEKFLDAVSTNYGAFYGYMAPPSGKPADARTAVGILCRMYMGWKKGHPGLEDGISAMANKGPSIGNSCNMYYNYYATQAMKHYGGETWKKWNLKMRDFLVKSQAKDGSTAGSWHFTGGGHADEAGGRLYSTAMCAMTLEVYYRYLPLYGDKAANDEFPLE
ncbi:MAG: prenyltransferase/squalene oxidase repeat-containing protein [Planctomycetota bacterium]